MLESNSPVVSSSGAAFCSMCQFVYRGDCVGHFEEFLPKQQNFLLEDRGISLRLGEELPQMELPKLKKDIVRGLWPLSSLLVVFKVAEALDHPFLASDGHEGFSLSLEVLRVIMVVFLDGKFVKLATKKSQTVVIDVIPVLVLTPARSATLLLASLTSSRKSRGSKQPSTSTW